MTDFAKAVEDFENACMALGDRGILEVGSDHIPKDLLKNHEVALETLMTFAAAPSEEPVAFVDAKGNLLVPDGSPLADRLKALPDEPFGGEVLSLFASSAVAPPVASANAPLKIATRLMALASPAAESLSDKVRIDEFVDAAIEAAGALRLLERRNRELMSSLSMMCGDA